MALHAPQHRDVWRLLCPACGNEMDRKYFENGHEDRCSIERCGYTIDVPYFGYVPTVRPANVVDRDRELE